MIIEERARQIGAEKLGPLLGQILTLKSAVKGKGRIRLATYYNALLLEVDGETWALAEATVADKFR